MQDKSVYCIVQVWNFLSSNGKTVWGHGRKELGFYRGVSKKGVFIKNMSYFQASRGWKSILYGLCALVSDAHACI